MVNDYKTIRSYVLTCAAVSAPGLAKRFGIGLPLALAYLRRMENDGTVGEPDNAGVRRVRSQEPAEPEPAPEGETVEQLRASVAELRATLDRLLLAGEAASHERDEWRRRALAAEARLSEADTATPPAGKDRRFARLKRLLAQTLHPDGGADRGDWVAKSDLFKSLWPKVEEIERDR